MHFSTREVIDRFRKQTQVSYDSLMLRKVQNVLLVASSYDSYTFEEDGRLTELIFVQYLDLNLRDSPNIVRVTTAEEALAELKHGSFDLVISMLRVGSMDIVEFGQEIANLVPGLPVVLLTHNTRELDLLQKLGRLPGIDRVFVWLGDVRLFLAIIKYIEDKLNVANDTRVAGVQSILFIEDNPRFYSAYLPMAYSELVRQTQKLVSDGLNYSDKMLRIRARPKLLFATTYEEAERIYSDNRNFLAGVFLDARFPKNGIMEPLSGIEFAKMVKKDNPHLPILLQSAESNARSLARSMKIQAVNKHSPNLLGSISDFLRDYMGFGDFIFRMPSGEEISRATDLRSFAEHLATIPEKSLLYHATHNHFSTWLMARTEFDLARVLKPQRVSEFGSVDELRQYLLNELDLHRNMSRLGVVTEFSSTTFEGTSGFARIGTGSLGGKGRGLAFMSTVIEAYKNVEKVDQVDIFVPPMVVLATGVFDDFMRQEDLMAFALDSSTPDRELVDRFLSAKLPQYALENLTTFLSRVSYPLAVRSSSQLEDSSYQPFAGLYKTYMLPNNHRDFNTRVKQLVQAVKLVYASTYSSNVKAYLESTPNRLEEEKMAVIIQQVFGRVRDNYLYPDIAGVVRSHDFYPMEGMKAEDGVASVVMGLGKTVVDGGLALRFSPAYPHRLYQFSTIEDTLKHAQRDFLALDLSKSDMGPDSMIEESDFVTLGLDVASKHGLLPAVGSVYSIEDDMIYDSTSRPGVPLVTMAGVLKSGVFPLAQTLRLLTDLGVSGLSTQVEIEFAANIRENPEMRHQFAFLQIRPIVLGTLSPDVQLTSVNESDAICVSHKALGNGPIDGVRDIVYVPGKSFERSKTFEIANEIGFVTARLKEQNRPYLLIGPGRWGSADGWLGIPVGWAQISQVRCIIETDMQDLGVQPSQGTHFFQNITSLGIGYFTVNFNDAGGMLDQAWLDAQVAEFETQHVRLFHFANPLQIVIDGKKAFGAVMKPDRRLSN